MALSPLSRSLSGSPLSPRAAADGFGGWSSPSKDGFEAPGSPVGLTARARDGVTQARPKRRLPVLAEGNKMRRAKSMSYLNSTTGPDRSRRRLPDPGQGRLIKLVEEKLKEESKQRLELAKELKQEKHLRWDAEDKLAQAQGALAALRTDLQERKRDMNSVLKDLAEEEKAKLALEQQLARQDKELERTRRQLHEERTKSSGLPAEAREDVEASIQEAWDAAFEEKRQRQQAEEQLDALKAHYATLLQKGLLDGEV